MAQLAPNDLVLLLILANTVQNLMNAGDNARICCLILAISLIALNNATLKLVLNSKKLNLLLKGGHKI